MKIEIEIELKPELKSRYATELVKIKESQNWSETIRLISDLIKLCESSQDLRQSA